MTAAFLIAVLLGQSPVVPAASATAPPPVSEWGTLPLFSLPRAAVIDGAAFVRGEVESGRCPVSPAMPDGRRLDAPVAILVGASGLVRQIVPQAIDCPTVEQYTVGYLLSLTRAGSEQKAIPAPGWYRLTVSYNW